MDVLWHAFHLNQGQMPPRKQRIRLAQQLDMKENQVYKWFWESQHKERNGDELCKLPRSVYELDDEQRFEIFVNKTLK